MKPENFEQRQKLLLRFVLLYVGSIALLILGFWALSSHEPAPAPMNVPAATAGDKQRMDRITAELDSTRQQVWRLRREMLIKDSLIDRLAMAPVPDIPDGAFEKQELVRMQKEQAAIRDALQKIRTDSTLLHQQLDDQVKTGTVLKDQVANLRHNNEALRGRTGDGSRSGVASAGGPDGSADIKLDAMPGGSANGRTATADRQSGPLNDELRFAEVDCSLSRADARQIVYNAKQRKELLTDALTTLNQLIKSPDAEVQRKARERLTTLRNIASTVHD